MPSIASREDAQRESKRPYGPARRRTNSRAAPAWPGTARTPRTAASFTIADRAAQRQHEVQKRPDYAGRKNLQRATQKRWTLLFVRDSDRRHALPKTPDGLFRPRPRPRRRRYKSLPSPGGRELEGGGDAVCCHDSLRKHNHSTSEGRQSLTLATPSRTSTRARHGRSP